MGTGQSPPRSLYIPAFSNMLEDELLEHIQAARAAYAMRCNGIKQDADPMGLPGRDSPGSQVQQQGNGPRSMQSRGKPMVQEPPVPQRQFYAPPTRMAQPFDTSQPPPMRRHDTARGRPLAYSTPYRGHHDECKEDWKVYNADATAYKTPPAVTAQEVVPSDNDVRLHPTAVIAGHTSFVKAATVPNMLYGKKRSGPTPLSGVAQKALMDNKCFTVDSFMKMPCVSGSSATGEAKEYVDYSGRLLDMIFSLKDLAPGEKPPEWFEPQDSPPEVIAEEWILYLDTFIDFCAYSGYSAEVAAVKLRNAVVKSPMAKEC